MLTIREIRNCYQQHIIRQEAIVRAVSAELRIIRNSIQDNKHDYETGIESLVPAGDELRYALLTRAAKAVGSKNDFTAFSRRIAAEDATNLENLKKLETQHGAQAAVFTSRKAAKQELDIFSDALSEVTSKVNTFDRATTMIKAHNEKYTTKQITEEDHDQFERFRFWSFIRNPWAYYSAYKALSDFDKKHGDYFDSARTIAKQRLNQTQLIGDVKAKNDEFQRIDSIASQMKKLSNARKGPEYVTNHVRGIVTELLADNPDFMSALAAELGDEIIKPMVLARLKIQNLSRLEDNLEAQAKRSKHLQSELEEPMYKLNRAPADGRIKYNIEALDRSVRQHQSYSWYQIESARRARTGIEQYRPAPNVRSNDMYDAMLLYMIMDAQTDAAYAHSTYTLERQIADAGNIDLDVLTPDLGTTISGIPDIDHSLKDAISDTSLDLDKIGRDMGVSDIEIVDTRAGSDLNDLFQQATEPRQEDNPTRDINDIFSQASDGVVDDKTSNGNDREDIFSAGNELNDDIDNTPDTPSFDP